MNEELYHFGVKGMKWGVRRKITKEYNKESKKAMKDLNKQANQIREDSYKEANTYMMKKGNLRVDKRLNKQYGKDYDKMVDADYEYLKEYEQRFDYISRKKLKDFYDNNEHVKRANKLVEKYNMVEWNEKAKKNTNTLKEMNSMISYLEKYFK